MIARLYSEAGGRSHRRCIAAVTMEEEHSWRPCIVLVGAKEIATQKHSRTFELDGLGVRKPR